MPDNPASPGPNGQGRLHVHAAGGTDGSNTDPYAMKPEPGNNWVESPHVMIVNAMDRMRGYPTDPKPDASKPYVMWAGTPYAHLMIPVK
jgi:hypothetical protein